VSTRTAVRAMTLLGAGCAPSSAATGALYKSITTDVRRERVLAVPSNGFDTA
jgi:hypothetical protein